MSEQINKSNVESPREVSLLLGLGILFMPLVFAWFTLRKGYSTKAKVVTFLWLFFTTLPLLRLSEIKSPNVALDKTVSIKESCLEVSKSFGTQSSLTDIQKEALWKSKYEGKIFEWPMVITEVSTSFTSGYSIQFKCRGSRSLVSDVLLEYPSEAKSQVVNLEKGSTYVIKGRLKNYITLIGLSGEGL